MDELELLKKDWQQQKEIFPKLSYKEIYAMLLKKSSSAVRWILIISILEFCFFATVDVIFRLSDGFEEAMTAKESKIAIVGALLSYGVLLFFVFEFYKNYNKIKTTDTVRDLMRTILKTRKTVKMYVFINITVVAVTIFVSIMYVSFFSEGYFVKNIDPRIPVAFYITVAVLVVAFFAIGVGLIYRMIYGVLTRKLKRNYQELEKIDL
ncbi:hypothetical protein NBT05_15395 [Aquimarina sp. ERC-38]|uniref:hypothetical protein n=1 Tax=Aquimarina sp. ERC-38 TaxID=2949996 RepID=UPI0022458677|nr:hypothetical protein [Aquimarina sp. ERC-38]UZO80327.1 hypothetical protein NBT05_15395 [Aquimarina sp. ERC-38]